MAERQAHWISRNRYYTATIQRDLLGDLVLYKCWGGRQSHIHHSETIPLESEQQGMDIIEQIHRIRTRHRYWRLTQK